MDSGVVAIHLEEPEFGFAVVIQKDLKRMELYYKEPWQPPRSSPDAIWGIKQKHFYTRAIDRICSYLKSYVSKYGLNIRFIFQLTAINYATWNIVSPINLIDLSSVDTILLRYGQVLLEQQIAMKG